MTAGDVRVALRRGVVVRVAVDGRAAGRLAAALRVAGFRAVGTAADVHAWRRQVPPRGLWVIWADGKERRRLRKLRAASKRNKAVEVAPSRKKEVR